MYHLPVMLNECVDALVYDPDGTYVDLTFGGGGHSVEILKRLNNKGRLIAFDVDNDAIKNKIEDERFTMVNQNFRYLWHYLKYYQVLPVNGVLADLGVSSFQIDESDRGFSIRSEGELDMRMGDKVGKAACDVINEYSKADLNRVFKEYGEINNYNKLTGMIIKNRSEKPIKTTLQLKEIAGLCAPRGKDYKYLSKVFQAVRIEVNDEIKALEEMLLQLEYVLKCNGRAVIMSYHSLEDRLVKNLFKTGNIYGEHKKDFYGNKLSSFKSFSSKPITPTEEELENNPRSRSAKLRIAEKVKIDKGDKAIVYN